MGTTTPLLDRPGPSPFAAKVGANSGPSSNERVAHGVSRWRRGSIVALVVSAAATVGMVIVNAASIWTNSDTSWTWLLPGQLMNGAPRAVSLVDGNRIFPDLLLSGVVRALTNVVGVALTGQRFVLVYDLIVASLAAVGILKIYGRSMTAAPSMILLLLLLTTDTSSLESIRPGYHALSAVVCLLLVARRYRRHGRAYDVLELSLFSALIASNRFLLTLVLVPLIATDMISRNVRAHRTLRLLIPCLVGLFGWFALNGVPGVDIHYAPTVLRRNGAITWLWDYARSMTNGLFATSGTIRFPTHGVFLALVLGLTFLVVVRRRFTVLSAPDRSLVALAVASSVIGGATLRAGGYLVGWRGYIFVFPLLMACVCLPRLFACVLPAPLLASPFIVIGALITVSFSLFNMRAVAHHPEHGSALEVHALLKQQGLIGRIGLTNYWVGYGTQSHYGDMPLYNVDSKLRPFFWVVNPWALWYDTRTDRLDLHRRIDYVMSSPTCDSDSVCDREGMTPRRNAIVAVLGEPDRWVRSKSLRLAIYDKGADSSKLLQLWKERMYQAHLSYRGVHSD